MKPISPQHGLFLRKQMRHKFFIKGMQIFLLVLALALWELLAKLQLIDSFFTSCPSRIMLQLGELITAGNLFNHIWASTFETLMGFLIGTALGYLIACILWWNDTVQKIFEPYIVVLNSLPKIALGPLIIIWVGTGKMSIIVMAVLISVIITIITLLNGFTETDENKVLLMRSMGASRMQILTKLVVPANVPILMATLKINVGMSWVGTIMGEYLVSKEGLGYLIVYGQQTMKLDLVVTCTIILCALAGIMYALVALLERAVVSKNY